jgi:hypothetical protein
MLFRLCGTHKTILTAGKTAKGYSMKKNKLFTMGTLAMMLAFGLVLAGCEIDADDKADPSNPRTDATLRYKTVPLEDDDGKAYSLITSAYDDDFYYYIYLLGHIERVPVVYGEAVEYNGVTPIAISYEESKCTEESVLESMSTSMENSVTNTVTTSWGLGAQVGIKAGPVEASLTATFNSETSKEEMQSRSTSNTWETMQTKMKEESFSVSYTIGDNNEPPGKYRYTLFGSTDVYFQLKTTKDRKVVDDAFTFACARPANTLFWGIDYDPDSSGDFGKTAKTENLAIPDLDLSALPQPTKELEEAKPPTPDPEPLETVWTKTETDEHYINDTDSVFTERFKTNFDLTRLRNEGYTRIKIEVEYMAKEITDGWAYTLVSLPTSLSNTGPGLGYDEYDIPGTAWYSHNFVRIVDDISIFNNYLYILYDAGGADKDEHTIGNRTYTITALKN